MIHLQAKELYHLSKIQEDFLLVYHPTQDSFWNDRIMYSNRDKTKLYNHRSVLDSEVIIEYDETSKKLNKKLAYEVFKRLVLDDIECAIYTSGNKSFHVHLFIEIPLEVSPSIFKRTIMKHYGDIGEYSPDMVLASGNHLIRCEYGVHEKTGNHKVPILKTKRYPYLNNMDSFIVEHNVEVKNIEKLKEKYKGIDFRTHPLVKVFTNPKSFSAFNDGKKRGIYHMTTLLRPYYSFQDTYKVVLGWYKSLNGYNNPNEVYNVVRHAYEKGYNFSFIKFKYFMEDLGVKTE